MGPGANKMPEQSEQAFEDLLRGVSARPRPPAGAEQAAFEQFTADLNRMQARRARNRKITYWALAASVLMVLLVQPLMFSPRDASGPGVALGTVDNHHGQVSLILDQQRTVLSPQGPVFQLLPRQTLLTDAGAGLSINWGGRMAVRVDQNTRLVLRSASEIELVSGRLYVDVPPGPAPADPAGPLSIVTRLATITHTGTQFMVSAGDEAIEVKVREGTVNIDDGSDSLVAGRGEETIVDDSGAIRVATTKTYGDDWQWVEKLTPGYPLEGSTLENFLYWIRRETGKDLVYESPEVQYAASNTILHGNVETEPMESLAMVLETTDLSWYEEDGIIHLSLNP